MHAISLLLALAALPARAPAPDARAHRHEPADAAPRASPRYPTDPALRQAMDGVRNAFEPIARARHGHMDPARVRALADRLDGQVARVLRDCSLPPGADSALHPVLLTILAADRALRESPGDVAPVDAVSRALADYARLFDDPGMREALSR